MARLFVTGYVLCAHGVDGAFKVKSASGETAHIARLAQVMLRHNGNEKVAAVEWAKEAAGCVLMKLRGVDSVEAACLLTGSEIVVAEDAAHQRASGEWYVDDLCGCAVVYDIAAGGVTVGRVADVIDAGYADLLEVEIDEGCTVLGEELRRTSRGKARRVMVPFTDEHIGEVSVEKRTVHLRHLWVLE